MILFYIFYLFNDLNKRLAGGGELYEKAGGHHMNERKNVTTNRSGFKHLQAYNYTGRTLYALIIAARRKPFDQSTFAASSVARRRNKTTKRRNEISENGHKILLCRPCICIPHDQSRTLPG